MAIKGIFSHRFCGSILHASSTLSTLSTHTHIPQAARYLDIYSSRSRAFITPLVIMDNESCGRAQEMLHLLLGCFPVHIKLFWNENHIRTLAPLPRIASICNSAPRVVTRNLFQISWRHNQPLPHSFIAACNLEPGHRFLCGHQFLRKLLRNFLCQKQSFPGKGVSCLKSAPGSRVLKILQIYIYVQRAVAVTVTLNDLHIYLFISIYLLTCGSVLS